MQHTDTTTLFCIPHAGGNAAYYGRFTETFPASVKVSPLDLPGKGRRCREPLLTDMAGMGRDLLEQMRSAAHTGPYAIFGHSMGGLLAFLCARFACDAALPPPRALFISSATTPDRMRTGISRPIDQLLPGALWDYVARMGGIPPEIARSQEFRSYLEPVLRSDFMAVEGWRPAPFSPLPLPVHTSIGDRDLITEADARHWQSLTDVRCTVRTFSGGHFYLQDHWQELADHITRILQPGV